MKSSPFSSTSVGFASPTKLQDDRNGWMITARSEPAKAEAGAALRITVASQLSNTARGNSTGPTNLPGMEMRPEDDAWKNASVSAATRSASACVNGVGPQVASTYTTRSSPDTAAADGTRRPAARTATRVASSRAGRHTSVRTLWDHLS